MGHTAREKEADLEAQIAAASRLKLDEERAKNDLQRLLDREREERERERGAAERAKVEREAEYSRGDVGENMLVCGVTWAVLALCPWSY